MRIPFAVRTEPLPIKKAAHPLRFYRLLEQAAAYDQKSGASSAILSAVGAGRRIRSKKRRILCDFIGCWSRPPHTIKKAAHPFRYAARVLRLSLKDRKQQRKHPDHNRENNRQFLKFCLAACGFALRGEGLRFPAERSAQTGAFRLLQQNDNDK